MVQIINQQPTIAQTLGNLLGGTVGSVAGGIGQGQQQVQSFGLQNQLQNFFEEKKQQKALDKINKEFASLGPEATIEDKLRILATTPGDEKTKKFLFENVKREGAKEFIKKIQAQGPTLENILEGQALGYIEPGAGVELLRGASGSREHEQAQKIYQNEFQDIQKSGNVARNVLAATKRQRELLEKKEKWGPFSLDNLFYRLGIPGLASPEGQEFQANLLNYLEGARQIFGVRLTDADLRLVQDKLPDIARTKEGNEAILRLRESEAMYNSLRAQAAQNVLREGKGFTYDYGQKVEEELERLLSQHPDVAKYYSNAAEELIRIAKQEPEQSEYTYGELPSAAENKGKHYEDKKGNVYKSNGKNWKRVIW